MCLRIQPSCNACETPAKPEEHYPCCDTACSSDDIEVIKRPLSRAELASTTCSNPNCNMNPGRIEWALKFLQDKVLSMQSQGRQPSLMRSGWATSDEPVARRNPNNSLNAQQQMPSAFSALNMSASCSFETRSSASAFASLAVPFDCGVTNARVASQASAGWSKKVTVTVEESGNLSSLSGGLLDCRWGWRISDKRYSGTIETIWTR